MSDKPSGSAFRKLRKSREEEARREEQERRALEGEPISSYEGIEPPPLDDATTGLVWARKCMLAALDEVIRDPVITAEKRWRFVSDLGGKIGMTYSKSLMEEKVDRVTKALGVKQDVSGGTESTKGIARPEGSRRRARRGVSDPIPGSSTDSEAGED